MAVHQSDLDETGGADAALAYALAQAVREVGRSLATDPRRVQGMVSDVLGVQSRTRRAEIDAVVLAAEESVPEDLLAGRIDVDTALDRLHDRGLDAGVAHFAVEVWRYALGMLADDAEPPSLTNSLQATTNPVITDAAPDEVAELSLGGVGDTVSRVDIQPMSDGEPVIIVDTATDPQPATLEPPGLDTVTGGSALGGAFAPPAPPVAAAVGPERSKSVFLIAAVVALAVIAGFVFVVTRGGDDELEVTAAASTVPATTPATSAPATTAPATTVPDDGVAEAVFDVETTPHGHVTRGWQVADGQFIGTLTFVNTTGADVPATRHFEVIPKSIVESAAAIVSVPPHVVVKDDPIIAWDFAIPVDGKVVIVYQTQVKGTITDNTLVGWKAKQLVDAAEFLVERTTPPALTVNTPNDSVITAPETFLSITVDPTATVTVNGVPVAPQPDGTYYVPGFVEGPNPLTIIATNPYGPYGAASTSTLNIFLQTPTTTVATTLPPPVAPTTTVRPSGSGGGTATTTTAPAIPPPPDTTTTTVYVPPPEPFSVYVSTARTTLTTGCPYVFYANTSGPAAVYFDWDPGSGATGSSAQFTFNAAGSYTVSVYAESADGQADSSAIGVNVFDGPTC